MDKLLGYCDGDPELAMSFLEMFRTEADVARGELPKLMGERRFDELSNVAHKLKSQCRYVGAEDVANLAQEVENSAEKGNIDNLEALLPKLYTSLDKVLSSF